MFRIIFALILVLNLKADEMKIVFITQSGKVLATLNDSRVARDFYSLLPLKIELKDYAGAEKYARLVRPLEVASEPSTDGKMGDISYFAPWGNFVIYYKNQPFYEGIIRLGRFDGDFSAVINSKNVEIKAVK
ncbi:cyclophilin-like fold protein [Campylobacter gastrosuis]|uniref:Cyclophilin-like fold protein n=1 Tax=Campylobacter gastrosuis TaxID=2974576 RepID=A0ABT7HR79_9BACT|nr:cyclophilin-like fold protein [Campylobacter gastrosuis]MDL0089414.1 cyclophilin-like fold protein [Campylobacter gastrosuis]